ncbi:hypothetical protein LINPERPRIM_LOCUS20027 [Linum perenne]
MSWMALYTRFSIKALKTFAHSAAITNMLWIYNSTL